MALDGIIKEYLVSMNLKVNQSQYSEFTNRIKDLDKLTESITSKTAKNVATASVTIVGFLASVTSGVAAFLDSLANTDMETQLFARRMWMTTENAKELQMTLQAMGKDMSDIQDIAMNPELRDYFFKLRAEIRSLNPPEEYADMMAGLRSIQFELQRFKLISSYALQWVGYYLVQKLNGPLVDTKFTLQNINDYIKDNIPRIAERVADVFARIVKVAFGLYKVVRLVIDTIGELWDRLSPRQKDLAGKGALGGLLILFAMLFKKANPFIKTLTVISGMIALIADYMEYLSTGDSAFGLGGLYDAIDKVFGDKELIVAFTDTLNGVLDVVNKLVGMFKELDISWREMTGNSLLESFLRLIKEILFAVLMLIDDIVRALSAVLDFIDWGITKLGDLIDKVKLIPEIGLFKWLKGDTGDKEKDKPSTVSKVNPFDFFSGMGAPVATVPSLPITYNYITENATAQSKREKETKLFTGRLNPTYNIYGSDPEKTAKAANDYNTMIINRALS